MATYATSTDVDTLRTALLGIIGAAAINLTHDTSAVQTLIRAQALLALDKYCDAQLAIINVNASAAENYSNGVGMSVAKAKMPQLMAQSEAAWDELVSAAARGGVAMPTVSESIGFWDMSVTSND